MAIIFFYDKSLQSKHPQVWNDLSAAWQAVFFHSISVASLSLFPESGPMKMTSEGALWCTGAIEYFHRTMSNDRRIELDLPVVRKRKSATIDPEAEEATASKTRRKSTGSNKIVPAPPSKPAPAPTPPSKMAAAPRPKNVPAPSPISKTPKRNEVAPDDEDPISKTPKHPILKTPKRNEVAPDDEDDEIEADENGTFGDN